MVCLYSFETLSPPCTEWPESQTAELEPLSSEGKNRCQSSLQEELWPWDSHPSTLGFQKTLPKCNKALGEKTGYFWPYERLNSFVAAMCI